MNSNKKNFLVHKASKMEFYDVSASKPIKIKLIITEVTHSTRGNNILKICSPILSPLFQFGVFHSALMVGPWLLEWYIQSDTEDINKNVGEVNQFVFQENVLVRKPF